MGWFSRIESPLLTKISIFIWSLFVDDLKLNEAKQQKFRSLRECFIRELKDGVRTVDNRHHIATSPCDAIVGACGRIEGNTVYQAKGFPYALDELIPDPEIAKKYQNGTFVTLRLKSSMYHRFHAPVDCEVNHITYISGDTWNVNPIALKVVERLFCKNERAVIDLQLNHHQQSICLVPIAAILVASMKFHCLENDLDIKYKGPNEIPCHAELNKGDEMGYFQHGSTVVIFATKEYSLCEQIKPGYQIQMGQPLLIED